MADGDVKNIHDSNTLETNENTSNDAEEADEDLQVDLDLGELDLTSQDEFILDEVDVHIQENLEDELVKEALEKGVDLRQYSRQIEGELHEVENASILDYIKESENIASLHNQIASCDTILESMETMLTSFQEDLGSISSEIQTLQEQSLSMNIRLKNRQAVRGELSQFVDEMVITDSMVKHICETPVTEQTFIEQLHELHHKISFAKEQSFKGALSVNDVGDVLEKLKVKAVQKIRDFVLQKIYQFRRPMTNYQIPQNALLKFRYFNEFLMAHHRQVAREIRDEYIDTMSKIYFSYFKTYISKILKLQFEEIADRDDLMGVEDNAKRGIFSAKVALKNRSTIFTLGNRGNVLTTELEEPVIVPHAALKSEKKYSFESLFRSMHFALLDNSCREYLFLADFFMAQNNTAKDLFTAVFGKTLSLFLKQMETYLESCFDAIGIFLCIHLVHRYRILMHKRNVPALDKYWDTILEMSWPRFTYVVELNVDSVRSTDPLRLGVIDIRPHYITRRYAEFSAAIVSMNESFPDEKVNKVLAALQVEVENFILRMAAEFPLRKEQLIFLINNYDMMLAVLMERTSEDSKEAESFQQLLTARIQEFVEEVLSPAFGGMTAFVKETEPLLERGQGQVIRPDERRIQQLVRGFASDWKRSIENINQEIMRSFSNFKNGTAILQAALTQLIQYYHRFQKILSQHPFKRLPIRSELINIHHVMVEVKKHKTAF
ncbi:PREDICTED: vacuolar protein sorting-associated protein 52 homolog isoform X1 [Acropora digitifera]|uniref:vacuolar protein sorting-associated protein 52 homolog isoform X1 n=1 Tax=Acropora digitifera TaxID=70779 RepID=UPI00077A5299|nr:PREDICTED: vacuolar protein sorting-associated protein 52 homolog isoform X1 [Acropora digitifera]